MKIFLVGASGAIGRNLIPRLVGAGHQVHGMTGHADKSGLVGSLGATPVGVLKLVFSSTAREVIGGLVLGIVLSLFLNRVLTQWAEASSQTPILFAGVTLLLVVTSAVAAWIPARRASSVDPMVALRYE